MLVKRFLIVLWLTSVSLLGAAACRPEIGSDAGAEVPSSETESTSDEAPASGEGALVDVTPMPGTEGADQPLSELEPGAGSASDQGAISSEGGIVDVTPMPDSELAEQPLGESEPSAGAASGEPDGQDEQLEPERMAHYADSSYQFEVEYPADFVFRTEPAEKLAQFTPMPVASFIFMNPGAAASDVAELEPADLEVRVYEVGEVVSLDSWLSSADLLVSSNSVPFQTTNVSGVEVCASTMIAPGCSYFVLGNGRVYRLTPASLAGEAMVDTFMLIP